jgi:hypothetical protein
MKDTAFQPNLLSRLGQEQPQPLTAFEPCHRCGCTSAKQVPGTGPHHAALRCANCGRFVKWLAKPGREV